MVKLLKTGQEVLILSQNYATALIRRSRLIMPASVRKFVEKAYLRNADAIVLDLEDSVPQAEKTAARTLVRELIPLAGKGGSDVFVRVNNSAGLLAADIDAAVWPGLTGLVIPKTETAAEIAAIEAQVARLEQARGIAAPQVRDVHDIRSRGSESALFIDMHILIDPEMSIAAAHDLVHQIEEKLKEEINPSLQALIHAEPDNEIERSDS